MPSIAGLPVKSTKELLSAATRLCMLVYAPAKRGKTRFAKGLDDVTKKYLGKPTLIIAVEAADGGGTMTLNKFDVDYVEPRNWTEFTGLISALQTDTTYGGVVIDNLTDVVKRLLLPEALKVIYKDVPPSRSKGVPERRDYQTMGELLRVEVNKAINLTKRDTPENVRKHLICTALENIKTTKDGDEIVSIGPALPGQMADTASAMFQIMATIEMRAKLVPDPNKPGAQMRGADYLLVTQGEGKKILGDRTEVFPKEGGVDLLTTWEKYWLPATTATVQSAEPTQSTPPQAKGVS